MYSCVMLSYLVRQIIFFFCRRAKRNIIGYNECLQAKQLTHITYLSVNGVFPIKNRLIFQLMRKQTN